MALSWVDETLRMTAANDGTTSRFTCNSITIRASADTWVAIIKDADGVVTKFEMASDVANDRGGTYPVQGIIFDGAVLTTATDLTSVTFNGTRHVDN